MDLGESEKTKETPVEEEEDPLWDDIDVEEIKTDVSKPLKKESSPTQ